MAAKTGLINTDTLTQQFSLCCAFPWFPSKFQNYGATLVKPLSVSNSIKKLITSVFITSVQAGVTSVGYDGSKAGFALLENGRNVLNCGAFFDLTQSHVNDHDADA